MGQEVYSKGNFDELPTIPIYDVSNVSLFLTELRSQRLTPELNLFATVLLDALDIIQNTQPKGKDKMVRKETVRWFTRHDQDSWTFSFENVCDVLNIAPSAIIRRYQKWLR